MHGSEVKLLEKHLSCEAICKGFWKKRHLVSVSGWRPGLFTPGLHCTLDNHKTNRQLHLTAHWSFCLHKCESLFSISVCCWSRCIALYFHICSQLYDVLYFKITSVIRCHENLTSIGHHWVTIMKITSILLNSMLPPGGMTCPTQSEQLSP